jgi:RHS repeat-associated protein
VTNCRTLANLEGGATTTSTYDDADELTVEYTPSARTTYTYDANGNTAAINAAGSRTTYSWDIENHNTVVQLPGGTRNTMTYDGDGKRRRIQDSDGLRNTVWDGENILVETDSGNSTLARYTLAPEVYGSLVSQRRSGATSFHHYDALGSTDRVTDSGQNTLVSYLYRAFGEQAVLSGSSASRFTWVGRLGYYRQADTSDYWVRARIEEPTGGRWRSRDRASLLLGTHRYVYAHGRPMNAVDPTGLHDWDENPPAPFGIPDVCGFSRIRQGRANDYTVSTLGERRPTGPDKRSRCARRTWRVYIDALKRKCRRCEQGCTKQEYNPVGSPPSPVAPATPSPLYHADPGLPSECRAAATGHMGGAAARAVSSMQIPTGAGAEIIVYRMYFDKCMHGCMRSTSLSGEDAHQQWLDAIKCCQCETDP